MLILIAGFRSYHLEPTPQALTGLFRIIKALGMEGLPLQEWAYFTFPFDNVFNTGSIWVCYMFLFPFSSFTLHKCCHTAQYRSSSPNTLLRDNFKLAVCSFSSLTLKHMLSVHYNLRWKGVRAGKWRRTCCLGICRDDWLEVPMHEQVTVAQPVVTRQLSPGSWVWLSGQGNVM